MPKSEFIPIAIALKPHGLRGHVVFKFYDETLKIEEAQHFFIELNGTYVPYFPEEIKKLPKGYRIKFEEINDVKEAEEFVQNELYLRPDELEKLKGDPENSISVVVGFRVYKEDTSIFLGTVSAVLENKYQDVIEIEHISGNKILVPYVEEFIKKVSIDEKYMVLSIPEGLIEIYVSK